MAPTLAQVTSVANAGPYRPDWASLAANRNPDWFADAKFGIFTHWGLYTVPEYRNEWYSRNMYIQGYPEFDHHVATYGPQREFGYKDFIPMFTADAFDADAWCALFARAGARYVMPVSEHHDGFQMYASDLSRWNAAAMGPKRDILGELADAARAHGLHFTTSNHRAEHWWFMGHGREFDSDVRDPMARGDFYWPATVPEPNEFDIDSTPAPTAEFLEDWLRRNAEIIDAYQPELLYLDWWVQHRAFKPYLKLLAAYYYNMAAARASRAAICYKYDALAWGAGIVDVERGGYPDPTPFVWQTDTAIARNSWCYTDSLEYKPCSELVVNLIDAVSKNGNLLLNVGPRADGSIADHDRALLETIGRWLDANGETIYGSRPWRIAAEGPARPAGGMFADQRTVAYTPHDWRFTARDGALYACCLAPSGEDDLTCTTFAAFDGTHQPVFNGVVNAVEQLGAGPVPFERRDDGMHIHPDHHAAVDPELPLAFRIDLG
ncbi:alpha-L-fucosidase [Bifidobacterium cuniculi]|uniref:alpha-L-fucosidase n=1 Tax=Bifidobacterium cuniculi TaxID=1688 RepID=A0A087AZN4_9BIFI|nr:alpha-L-fucosidase [Bifidobacterium cuniculi]KFI64234.1 alpha-L-fucosidase [Bifidobacterium cuniculi]